mgnify:CR=1 FL=1
MSIKDFSDSELIKISKVSKSWKEFSSKLGYKSDSILRTNENKIRIKELNIKIINKFASKYKVSDETILKFYKTCKSVSSLMIAVGLTQTGYAHARFKERIFKLGIYYDPIKARCWNKGRCYKIIPGNIYKYLVKNCKIMITSSNLRKKLIDSGIKKHQCEKCKRKTWLGKPIKLQLDHVDGDRKNQLPNNIKILCPNCHSFTETHSKRKDFANKL